MKKTSKLPKTVTQEKSEIKISRQELQSQLADIFNPFSDDTKTELRMEYANHHSGALPTPTQSDRFVKLWLFSPKAKYLADWNRAGETLHYSSDLSFDKVKIPWFLRRFKRSCLARVTFDVKSNHAAYDYYSGDCDHDDESFFDPSNFSKDWKKFKTISKKSIARHLPSCKLLSFKICKAKPHRHRHSNESRMHYEKRSDSRRFSINNDV
jgi:hypothetical protein